MEDDIKLGIRFPISKKVVMGGMLEISTNQAMFGTEVFEEVGSGNIIGIDIAVTPQVNWTSIVLFNVFNACFQVSQGRYKFCFSPTGRHVEGNVD